MPYEVQSRCTGCNGGDTVLIGNWPEHLGILVCTRCKALVNIETDVGKCPGCGYAPAQEQLYDYSFAIPYIGGKFMREPEQGPLCPKCGGGRLTFETNTHINMLHVVANREKALAAAGKDYMEKAIFLNSLVAVADEFCLDVQALLDYFNLDVPALPLITNRLSFPVFMDIRTHVATRLTMENDAFGCKLRKEEIIDRIYGLRDKALEARAAATMKAEISAALQAVNRDELAQLQGTWVLVEMRAFGRIIGEEELSKRSPITMVIEGHTYQERFLGTFEIDPTKTPKWFDKTPPAEAKTGNRVQLGIYQYEGERLRIRTAAPSLTERPADFTTTDNSGYVTMLYVRASLAVAKMPEANVSS
jgi:uncharacterized protein (TIGR03067 family)